ncbi:MAG: hypothetical protein M1396_03625 [Chloroflexi bacterium]|nr:hypothetical protein [Chloroflexota bacterium]
MYTIAIHTSTRAQLLEVTDSIQHGCVILSLSKPFLAVAGRLFQSQFVQKLAWPYLMAATTVTILPIIILFYATQKSLVEGISITGLKG